MALRILFLGDIVAAPGRALFQKHIQHIKQQYNIDAVIVNGENCAGDGRGITPRIMKFFRHNGVSMVTSGNHIFQKREIYSYLNEHKDLLRPINFPSGCPGTGIGTFEVQGVTVGVINVQGRVFMREFLDCPFRSLETALTFLKAKTKVIVVDMHAETTAEKTAVTWFVDGKVSAVVGTHTHVQTADERIFPGGTAYITDLGMSGPLNSVIGMRKEIILQHLISQMPVKFEVEKHGPMIMTGAFIDIDPASGKAQHIERIKIIDTELHFNEHDFADK